MPAPNPDLPPFDPSRLAPVKRALISVSDKSRLIDQAKALHERGVKLVSTGGTHKAITAAGIPVKDVSELTKFPEMMDGRVKTLHPMVHGGLLGDRDLASHKDAMHDHGILSIDLLVVNLYTFEQAVALSELCRELRAHVNLIPLNPTPGYLTVGTDAAGVAQFRQWLLDRNTNATIRRNRGTDIDAACGQLRANNHSGAKNSAHSQPVANPRRRDQAVADSVE